MKAHDFTSRSTIGMALLIALVIECGGSAGQVAGAPRAREGVISLLGNRHKRQVFFKKKNLYTGKEDVLGGGNEYNNLSFYEGLTIGPR